MRTHPGTSAQLTDNRTTQSFNPSSEMKTAAGPENAGRGALPVELVSGQLLAARSSLPQGHDCED